MARTWATRVAGAALAATAVAGTLACSGTDAGSGAAGTTISDSAGVRIVRIPGLQALSLPERTTTVAAELGTRPGTELFRVTAGRLLASGRLALGNSGTAEVLYVDRAGEVVGRVGGEGDGPGEFRHITAFPDVRGDTLTVYDVRLGRLTVLDASGGVVDTRALAPPSRVVDLLPLATGGGSVLVVHGDSRFFAMSGVRRDTVPLMVMADGAVDTVSLWPGKQWSFAATGRGSFRTEFGFGRSLEASGRDGRAVLGSTDRLGLEVVTAGGEPVMRIEGTGESRPVTEAEVAAWRAGRLAELPDGVPSAVRTALEEAPYNETYPAFSGLLLDASGRIWVAEAPEVGAEDRRWVVFLADGTPSFRLVLPAGAEPLDAAGDRLVLLGRTELGEEIVRVLALGRAVVAGGEGGRGS